MNLESIIVKLSCILFLAGIMAGCSEKEKEKVIETPHPEVLMLFVDKNLLKSDGNDLVTFAVSADGNDISANAKLYYKTAENTPFELSGKSFSTNISGTYLFYATYDGLTSQEIQIEAMAAFLMFSADTATVKVNGKSYVTFTLTADGEDVSDKTDIFRKNDDSDILLENNIFVPDEEGTYEFYCNFNGQLSESVTITAVPIVISLSSNESSLKANGKESVSFTVMEEDNDITNEAEIYLKTGDDNILIENHTFNTLQEGHYEFYARYLYQTSNTIDIEAVVSRLTLSADKTDIKFGETITFTAISDDVDDVSNDVTLHITFNDQTTTLNGSAFTPSFNGSFSVYATYDGKESNAVEIKVSPKIVMLTVDKSSLKSTGADIATFTLYVDDTRIDDADIYLVNPGGDIKISNGKFSSNLMGSYSFYALYEDSKSEVVTIDVTFVNFIRQTCAMAFVATWCGFSPEYMECFNQIRSLYSNQIQVILIHRSTSTLASTDIVPEDYLDANNITYTPYGIIDFREDLVRNVSRIYQAHRNIIQHYPAKSGIAITSQIKDNNMQVTLRIKVNETNEYSVGAIIVEDGVVRRQVVYYNNSHDDYEWKDNFVHYNVATYLMPGASIQSGKHLGLLQAGQEVTESFSIPVDKPVTTAGRVVKNANCRVVAYVFKKEGDNYFINNATTCPINGSVDYKYEQ